MSCSWSGKLSGIADLTDAHRAVPPTFAQNLRFYAAAGDVHHQCQHRDHVLLMLKGLACGHQIRRDRRRQILAFFDAGDICDVHVFVLKALDHSTGALRVAKIAAPRMSR